MKKLLLSLAVAAGVLLSGCGVFEGNVRGTVFYRDPQSGAKAGLSYGEDGAGSFVRVPVFDPQTGEMIALAEVELVPDASVVTAAK